MDFAPIQCLGWGPPLIKNWKMPEVPLTPLTATTTATLILLALLSMQCCNILKVVVVERASEEVIFLGRCSWFFCGFSCDVVG